MFTQEASMQILMQIPPAVWEKKLKKVKEIHNDHNDDNKYYNDDKHRRLL